MQSIWRDIANYFGLNFFLAVEISKLRAIAFSIQVRDAGVKKVAHLGCDCAVKTPALAGN